MLLSLDRRMCSFHKCMFYWQVCIIFTLHYFTDEHAAWVCREKKSFLFVSLFRLGISFVLIWFILLLLALIPIASSFLFLPFSYASIVFSNWILASPTPCTLSSRHGGTSRENESAYLIVSPCLRPGSQHPSVGMPFSHTDLCMPFLTDRNWLHHSQLIVPYHGCPGFTGYQLALCEKSTIPCLIGMLDCSSPSSLSLGSVSPSSKSPGKYPWTVCRLTTWTFVASSFFWLTTPAPQTVATSGNLSQAMQL